MVAGADVLVDAVARADHALAALELHRVFGAQAALAYQLAFAVGDDHLEAVLGALQRVLEDLDHFGDAISAHLAQPGHPHGTQRGLDIHARRAVSAGCRSA
jgi:hypothetical protein